MTRGRWLLVMAGMLVLGLGASALMLSGYLHDGTVRGDPLGYFLAAYLCWWGQHGRVTNELGAEESNAAEELRWIDRTMRVRGWMQAPADLTELPEKQAWARGHNACVALVKRRMELMRVSRRQ